MAVTENPWKAQTIKNAEAQIPLDNPITSLGGRVRIAIANFAIPAASPILIAGDLFFLAKLPSHAIVTSILCNWRDLSASVFTLDFGIYKADQDYVALNGGAYTGSGWHSSDTAGGGDNSGIANIEIWASDISAATSSNQLQHEAWFEKITNAHRAEQQLWELSGESSDPVTQYYVGAQCKTMSSVVTTAEDICFRVFYTID